MKVDPKELMEVFDLLIWSNEFLTHCVKQGMMTVADKQEEMELALRKPMFAEALKATNGDN